jgi:ATP-dependent DNA helicase RecG
MKPSLQKLQKFFRLEAERGYDNRAVLGGLDRILDNWEAEARIDNLPEDLIRAVGTRLRDYPRLTPSSRAEALEGLWRRIQKGEEAPPVHPSPEIHQPMPDTVASISTEPANIQEEILSPRIENSPREELPGRKSIDNFDEKDQSSHGAEEYPLAEETAAAVSRQSPVDGPPAALNAPVTVLPGVGPRHASTLSHLGIQTLRDMLYYFPRRYDDYTQLKPINRLRYGEEVTVIGTVQSINSRNIRSGRMQIVEAVVSDGSGALRVTWFNQPWIGKRLHSGTHISLAGKVDQYLGRMVMNNPEWEPLEQQQLSTNRIVPVYPLTAQITQRWLRKLMDQVVVYWAPRVHDPLPENVRRSAGLMDLSNALLQTHFPDSWDRLKAARFRLAFDEIFLLQLGVLRQKRAWQERTARVFETPQDWLEAQVASLPFQPTGAQMRAIQDVKNDLASGHPMNRLLQGDVGSGKTIVAALAVAMIAHHAAQSAFMAPTSILAEQHYKNLLNLLAHSNSALLRPGEIRLLIGATPEAEKREIREGLANGAIKLVIGTHALIEDPVTFADLELTIVDEQHRFGVEQRAALRSKGTNPHLLVMTATPIPRSLALTIYGDLELSVMDEMPPGRQAVATFVLTPRERERAYSLIRSQIEQGRQAFIIYPLIQENDNNETKAAVEEHAHIQSQVFPKLKIGLLHGRLRPEEKDGVMSRFRAGDYHILVSTSVVEVGVDVPNATVMIIEGANHFGLAQLHQFRGRVGRGGDKAYCLLIPDTSDAVENERLLVMTQTNDGFVLAQRDLEQRGPGQFLGTRQSGFNELQLASLTDVHLIEKARRQAQALFEQDPNLERPEHKILAADVNRFWGEGKGDIS